ncbi:MAG: bifunctional DNA primase/polymerase [Verrucomicrobia bacterium]|nr:bifunctional DNA primase/polymerase [Verrucomicrobiota bacterium]
MENKELRFSKVRFRSKRPLERAWVNKPYAYLEILPYIEKFKNYGVLCGHGGLAVPDADSPELEAVIESALPETFTVQTGGGGKHYYFICRELHRRIVLERDGEHLGEVQSFGQQVIGPGSVHPNGNLYAVVKDLPILEISYAQLGAALNPFIRKPRKHRYSPPPDFESRAFCGPTSIPIRRVMDISAFKHAANGELYGPNPWHGSTTGMNTWCERRRENGGKPPV